MVSSNASKYDVPWSCGDSLGRSFGCLIYFTLFQSVAGALVLVEWDGCVNSGWSGSRLPNILKVI